MSLNSCELASREDSLTVVSKLIRHESQYILVQLCARYLQYQQWTNYTFSISKVRIDPAALHILSKFQCRGNFRDLYLSNIFIKECSLHSLSTKPLYRSSVNASTMKLVSQTSASLFSTNFVFPPFGYYPDCVVTTSCNWLSRITHVRCALLIKVEQ